MMIETIIFDFDDTLVVEEASAESAFLATCLLAQEEYGIDHEALHETLRHRARELWYRSPARAYCVAVGVSSWEGLWGSFPGDDPNCRILREWAPTYRRESWSQALLEFGVDSTTFAEHLANTFACERRKRHIVYPDVRPALTILRDEYRLALLSNGACGIQREKLEGSKLELYFDTVVISGEIGVGKPDARVFCEVLDRLQVQPEMAVMVGDSLTKDIAGAQNLGLKAVWLNRAGHDGDGVVEPDAEITTLAELPIVLGADGAARQKMRG